jgi:hypothetical protein
VIITNRRAVMLEIPQSWRRGCADLIQDHATSDDHARAVIAEGPSLAVYTAM